MSAATPVLVLGAGRMGRRIARMLGADARFSATISSRDADALALAAASGLHTAAFAGAGLRDDLYTLLAGVRAVILTDAAMAPAEVARLALERGCNYLDIFEDTGAAAQVAALAGGAGDLCLAPGCGLAPGYVTALAAELLAQAGPQSETTVFVGVLPAKRENRLGYANIWGIDGLLDEYTNPCLALQGGALTELAPLTQTETLRLGGTEFEAFTTAGSLDALARRHAGKVGGLVFKTLRYPGHLDYMQFLLQDLGLAARLYQLRALLTTALPETADDRVLIAIRQRATPDAPEVWTRQELRAAADEAGAPASAAATATAAHACAMIDLICSGSLPRAGLISPGDIGPALLRQSRFFAALDPARATAVPI
ncbi:MAG: saccharopine dehydrogenase C-terminal domain-containing protein [Phaeovulum sp.]|uniref:saccharopine dehydrogenase C-terminal domain-containing protein n=1 Tax=Phaeovulum sp. TaxID=2934796 RepID=UPI002736A533|nr:saccharopine dehydrogenase C-terminal domain-containing protein [Phaeovulum sp.]MDP3861368.1 saccharopine dehydrogenase C-terminal domain-containing protein [Phaeovulum sp.]